MILQKGTLAPDFDLNATPDQHLRLSELRGKRIVLAFYPADWSPVCGDQLDLFNETLKYFANLNAQVVAISVDSTWSHVAFSRDRNFHFPLLADFEPKGRSEEHTSELQSRENLVCRLLLEQKNETHLQPTP